MKSKFAWLYSLFFLCLMSCSGYHFGTGSTINSYHSISVPYVEGDWDGTITSAIIKEISEYTSLTYREHGGALILKVKVLDYEDENIGFRYDRKKNGQPRNVIIPDETRTIIRVEVVVVEASSGRDLLGPVEMFAEVEYDHDYYSTRKAINVFSLGQLSDIDEAKDAAQDPLNKHLAEKIVAYVKNNW